MLSERKDELLKQLLCPPLLPLFYSVALTLLKLFFKLFKHWLTMT